MSLISKLQFKLLSLFLALLIESVYKDTQKPVDTFLIC